MARVSIVFEDIVEGPLDGAVNVSLVPDRPIEVTDDNGKPVSIEDLTTAQREAFVTFQAIVSTSKDQPHYSLTDKDGNPIGEPT